MLSLSLPAKPAIATLLMMNPVNVGNTDQDEGDGFY